MLKIFLFSLLVPSLIKAESFAEIEVLGKVKMKGNSIEFIPRNQSDAMAVPSLVKDQKLINSISSLESADEAFVKGHVIFQKFDSDGNGQMKPVFVIESVKPISLKRIGDIGDMQDFPRKQDYLILKADSFAPWSIPVSTEIASAITMTSAMLLMQSLTASPLQPEGIQQIQRGLILSAGALMTGALIIEKFTIKDKK